MNISEENKHCHRMRKSAINEAEPGESNSGCIEPVSNPEIFQSPPQPTPIKSVEPNNEKPVIKDISPQKQAEEALKVIQSDIYQLLDAIPVPISISTYPDHRLLLINNHFTEKTGFTRDKLPYLFASQLKWQNPAEIIENDKVLQDAGKFLNREVHFYSKSNEVRTVLLSTQKVKLGDKEYLISNSIDITDRKKTEEALQESETFNQNILTHAPNPILVLNPDSSIHYVNPALEKLTGYSCQELLGLKIPYPWWPPEKIEEYSNKLANIDDTEASRQEIVFKKKNGEVFWVVSDAIKIVCNHQTKYILANWTDITNHRRAEEQIKNDRLQLQSILDALTEGVSLIGPDGIIMQVNKAEGKLLGVNSKDLHPGTHFINPKLHIIYPDGKPLPMEESSVAMAAKRKRSIRNFELGMVKEDGTTVWLNSNAVPIIDENQNVRGVVHSTTDITERKRLQVEREQFTRKLLEAHEEERKRISRDLHDDTAQYLSLLTLEMDSIIDKEQHQLPPETLSRLRKLHGMAERALKEVRRFSHELRPGVLEHFGLSAALEQTVSEFNTTCNTEVSFNVEGAEKRLSNDYELALFRIAQEALNNIRKHARASEAKVVLSFTSRKVRLNISDNGEGFSMRSKIHTTGKGSLGLVGMRERAHLIGATLKLKSKLKKGTIISVELRTG